MSANSESIRRFCDRAPGLKILVVGDAMLDTYVSGDANRISPEAPVPVVLVSGTRWVAGGAANVAANIRALGSTAFLGGVTGADSHGALLRAQLHRADIDVSPLIEVQGRVTTNKTRITAGGQQIVRFDEEDTAALAPELERRLEDACRSLLGSMDACIVSDYAKGVASASFCSWLIGAARNLGKPIVVDPKSRDLARYCGATVITPNLKETAAAVGDSVHSAEELAAAAGKLTPLIAPSALLVTQGGEGMSLFEPNQPPFRLPAMPVEVADVTGAGDTVVAVLAIALGMGMALREAAALANTAAGIAVRHAGTRAVTATELLAHSAQ